MAYKKENTIVVSELSILELVKELFPAFRKCLKKVRSPLLDNDAGTGRHGEGANPPQTFISSSLCRPISASPCQLNQRFPSRLTSPLSNEEIISLRVLKPESLPENDASSNRNGSRKARKMNKRNGISVLRRQIWQDYSPTSSNRYCP